MIIYCHFSSSDTNRKKKRKMRLKLEDKTSRIKVGMKRKSACPPARSAAEADCAPSIESRSNHVDNYRAITFYSLLLCVSLFSFNLILSIFLPPSPSPFPFCLILHPEWIRNGKRKTEDDFNKEIQTINGPKQSEQTRTGDSLFFS